MNMYNDAVEKKTDEVVRIVFYRSKSKFFNRAVSLAKSFPIFIEKEGWLCCVIENAYDFCRLQLSVMELIQIVKKWNKSEIYLYGKKYQYKIDYSSFLEQVKKNAGKYSKLIYDNDSNVSLGHISLEDLPYPIVLYPNLYGAFFAFSKDIGMPIVFCECERTAIENYLKLRNKMPLTNYSNDKVNPFGTDCFPTLVSKMSKGSTDPLSLFEFKEGICFRCNKMVPRYTYCLPMYGGSFKQHYGWYIKQEYYKLGIDEFQISDANVLEDVCDPETFDSLMRLSSLRKKRYADSSIEELNEEKRINKLIEKTIENSVRLQFGFRKIGDAWTSETILYEIVCKIFEGKEVKRHYRPSWLEGLELDIYVPDCEIAFEYQGVQHFKAVKHWGGEKQLQKQKEHDNRKKMICLDRGINLICVNYFEPLTTEYIVNRINE